MKVILYINKIVDVSGLMTFTTNFVKALSPYHDITIVYNYDQSTYMLDHLRSLCKCEKYENSQRTSDICIFVSVFADQFANIKASKCIQIVHGDIKTMGVNYQPRQHIEHVAVSETVQRQLKENYNIESNVINNLLIPKKLKKVLRLVTVSRIDKQKGFERMYKLAKALKEDKCLFTWLVFGESETQYINEAKELFKDMPEVVFMGATNEAQSWINKSDYLVQLSDHEGYCYAMHEALQVHTPCIVTDFDEAKKIIKDGYNGIILNMDMSNIDLGAIYHPWKIFTHTDQNEKTINLWNEYLIV